MRKFEVKAMSGEVSDVDSGGRKVKAVWARTGNVDRDSDIILPGAFTKTISECGPQGTNEIWALANHYADFKAALGKPSQIYEEGDKLVTITDILDTEIGEDILKLYTAGCINQHSIGFSTIKSDWQDQEQKVRLIKEVKLYEGGPVLWGANPETPTVSISKSLKTIEETKKDLNSELECLIKAFKHGTFNDSTFSLLEIQIKQIQSKILELTTKAAVEAPQPENNELLKALKETNLKLKKLL
jgi:HK97 family phage prohead protease